MINIKIDVSRQLIYKIMKKLKYKKMKSTIKFNLNHVTGFVDSVK